MEHEPVPIVDGQPLLAQSDAGDLLLNMDIDHIVRFPNPQYDYLAYIKPETNQITMVFLGQEALSTLVEYGLRQTLASSITERELDSYAQFRSKLEASHIDDELSDLLDNE